MYIGAKDNDNHEPHLSLLYCSASDIMAMSVFVQRFTLPAGQDHARIALDEQVFTEELWNWKTISFVRNK